MAENEKYSHIVCNKILENHIPLAEILAALPESPLGYNISKFK